MKVYIETYGCALSRGESLVMESILRRRGAEIVGDPRRADVVIINTCIVRAETEDRMRRRIAELYSLTSSLGSRLVVAGCMAKAMPYTVSKIAPTASLVAPQSVELIDRAVFSEKRVILLGDHGRTLTPSVVRGRIAVIPIADGCLGDCNFCIVKYARRRLRSYPPRALIEAVEKAVRMGAVEIELTAPDTAVYGIDLAGRQMLADLVSRIVDMPGNYMVRIGMMTPEYASRMLDDLIDVLTHPRVYKFIHLPLQSGDNRVLRLMGRRYTVEEYSEIVETLRRRVPGISIATDIIVGYPGEDEEAFQNTLRAVEELGFERVHAAQYSIRPHTPAAAARQVPENVKKERMARLLRVVERVGLKAHRRYVDRVLEVLVTEKGFSGGLVGRLENYIPVVFEGPEDLLGKRVRVKAYDATFYDVRAELVSA